MIDNIHQNKLKIKQHKKAKQNNINSAAQYHEMDAYHRHKASSTVINSKNPC
jgi:hypothetical protein